MQTLYCTHQNSKSGWELNLRYVSSNCSTRFNISPIHLVIKGFYRITYLYYQQIHIILCLVFCCDISAIFRSLYYILRHQKQNFEIYMSQCLHSFIILRASNWTEYFNHFRSWNELKQRSQDSVTLCPHYTQIDASHDPTKVIVQPTTVSPKDSPLIVLINMKIVPMPWMDVMSRPTVRITHVNILPSLHIRAWRRRLVTVCSLSTI